MWIESKNMGEIDAYATVAPELLAFSPELLAFAPEQHCTGLRPARSVRENPILFSDNKNYGER